MLSDKINSLPISQTVAMTAKAHDLKNQGIDVIGFFIVLILF